MARIGGGRFMHTFSIFIEGKFKFNNKHRQVPQLKQLGDYIEF